MGTKLESIGSRQVLEYTVVKFRHPSKKTVTQVPRIIGQPTIDLDEIVHMMTYERTMSETLFKAQFANVMEHVKEYLEKGYAVNLGGYLRIQPYLKGNVNESGEISPATNELAVRVSPLAKLKLKLRSFVWRLKGDRVKDFN